MGLVLISIVFYANVVISLSFDGISTSSMFSKDKFNTTTIMPFQDTVTNQFIKINELSKSTLMTMKPISNSTIESNIVTERASDHVITNFSDLSEDTVKPNHRVITYDQRQDGQYNIRADLENFMILLIPPNPTDSLGLLDILTKASLRHLSSDSGKNKKKYSDGIQKYSSVDSGSLSDRHSINYLLNIKDNEKFENSAKHADEFIEGRTPYHVEISSTNDYNIHQKIRPDRQVDVLPPPNPLVYTHLIKPYHLEADAAVIQTLPPEDMNSKRITDNYLEAFQPILPPKPIDNFPTNNVNFHRPSTDYAKDKQNTDIKRISRAMRNNYLSDMTNSIVSDSIVLQKLFPISYYNNTMLKTSPEIYSQLDVKSPMNYIFFNTPRNKADLKSDLETDINQSLDSTFLSTEILGPYLKWDGESNIQVDGIERCAPGKRRDSYGICREIIGY